MSHFRSIRPSVHLNIVSKIFSNPLGSFQLFQGQSKHICLTACSYVYLFICLSVYLSMSICLSVCPHVSESHEARDVGLMTLFFFTPTFIPSSSSVIHENNE